MSDFPTIDQLVGNTPLVRMRTIGQDLPCEVLLKLEMFNPGYSVKDRIGPALIDAAERDGRLQPGGTIVEPTSGNTGVGLAMAALERGYRCVFVMPDKISLEKQNLLRAYGAEVIVCPTAVEPEDPRSYYSVSDMLARELPGACKPDQYHNQANPQLHYRTTGPELWEQVDGRIDAFVAGVGTGGTISGTGRYLKERNPDVTIVGVDPEGSIYTDEDNVHTYLVEGVGEDFWPTTFDREIVDHWEVVGDREAFDVTRELARVEGILAGGSCGMALAGALRYGRTMPEGSRMVVLLPDSGRGYISKVYNPDWLEDNGMVEPEVAEQMRGGPATELVAERIGPLGAAT